MKERTTVTPSLGAAFLLSGLTAALGVSILIAASMNAVGTRADEPNGRRRGATVGDMATAASLAENIEATYGPLNKSATHEAKEGIFSRMIARRRAARSYTVVSSHSTNCPQSYVSVSRNCPTCPQPYASVPQKPAEPLNQPCPNCLDIQVSKPPTPREALLEATYGPLNKAALGQVKQAATEDQEPTNTATPAAEPETSHSLGLVFSELENSLAASEGEIAGEPLEAAPTNTTVLDRALAPWPRPLPDFSPTLDFEIQPSK